MALVSENVAEFTDESGAVIRFVPLHGEWIRPPAIDVAGELDGFG